MGTWTVNNRQINIMATPMMIKHKQDEICDAADSVDTGDSVI
jgi:hypothetical protein